ncbi:TPA: hypothetical protein ACQVH3_005083 [Serratia marcescens]
MDILFSRAFQKNYKNFPEADRRKIWEFREHVKRIGMKNLEGRNKNSDCVNKDDPNFISKVKFAVKHDLWHYHIGIARYDTKKPFGDRTSEWVLHYINHQPEQIKVVDMGRHPPFIAPLESYLD